MLAAVTGTPGMGKTLFSVRRIVEELMRGKVVATNVPMQPDFLEVIARHRGRNAFRSSARARWVLEAERRFFFSDDATELMALRLRGRGESRGVMVLDEAHDWMNSRNWQDGDRQEFVRWFSRHRKLGWDVYLVTQYLTNIDSQVRNLCEYHVTLTNVRNGAKIAGIPLCPFNLFLAVWRWSGGTASQQAITKRNVNRLTPWVANLYDTFGGTGMHEIPDDLRHYLPRELVAPDDTAGADASLLAPATDGTTDDADLARLLVDDVRLGALAAECLQTREGSLTGLPSLPHDVSKTSCNRIPD